MRKLKKFSFIGFLIIAVFLAGNGVLYLFSSEIMPYHQTAMGIEWSKLSIGEQIMSLSFMKSAAAGFLTTSIAMLFLLFIPFRKNERWSVWALFIISFVEVSIILSRIVTIRMNTLANPPIIPFILLLIFSIISFIVSIRVKERG